MFYSILVFFGKVFSFFNIIFVYYCIILAFALHNVEIML